MPANTSPIFGLTPILTNAQVTTQNTTRDATGLNVVDVFTASGNGCRIDTIKIKATGTTTAGMIRIFLYDGTSTRLFTEVLVTAITASATVASFESTLVLDSTVNYPIYMKSGDIVKATTQVTETFNIEVQGVAY